MANKTLDIPRTVADLRDASYNPRHMSESALTALGVSQSEFGDISGFVFNVRTGNLVAGHQRKKNLPADAKITGFEAVSDAHGTVGHACI